MKKIKEMFKRIIVFSFAIVVVMSGITNTYYCVPTYAGIETVVLSEEVLRAIISALSGAAIGNELTDEQKITLFNQNKISYGETIKFIVKNPDVCADMLETDAMTKFLDACSAYNNVSSDLDEVNKYIDGNLAEQIEDMRDQFSLYFNNKNPNDDDNNKFKELLKRAVAMGGAIGIAAGSILSVIYGINIDEKEDNCFQIKGGNGTYIESGCQMNNKGEQTIYIENKFFVKNIENETIQIVYPMLSKISFNDVSGVGSFATYFLIYNNSTKKYSFGTSTSYNQYVKCTGYSRVFSNNLETTKEWTEYSLHKVFACNFPRFDSIDSMKEYVTKLNDGMELEEANSLYSKNYDDGSIKIPDNLDDSKKIDAQKWADVKNLIDLKPNAKGVVRGFIGIYENSVADLSKLGTTPSTDDIEEAVKKQVKKVIDPDEEPTPAPTTVPESTPAPSTVPEPTPAPSTVPEPTPAPSTAPEPTPAPTTVPEPESGINIDYTGFLQQIIELLRKILNAILSFMSLFVLDLPKIEDAIDKLKNNNVPEPKMFKILAEFKNIPIIYPKLIIDTPAVIKQFYHEDTITLVDFMDYKKYCVWARELCQFAICFAFGWSFIRKFQVRIHIG